MCGAKARGGWIGEREVVEVFVVGFGVLQSLERAATEVRGGATHEGINLGLKGLEVILVALSFLLQGLLSFWLGLGLSPWRSSLGRHG